MNKKSENLEISRSLTSSILESITDGVFTVDADWHITSFNHAAEQITGVKRQQAIGKRCCDVFRSSMCQKNCALRETLESKRPIVDRPCFIVRNDGKRIPISVSTAVLYNESGEMIGGAETFRDLTEIEALRKELGGRYSLGDLISRSSTMRKVFEIIPILADTFSTVLIQGETGTGKEVVAKAVHGSGCNANKPFVAINCGALPDNLLESELFGYKKGAFTGAYKDKPGLIETAKDGTLFLDEIGDISPSMQVKLLRVLQEKTFQPLGGTNIRKLKARIIAATNRDLVEMLKNGQFREDLFYRINVIRIDLPPLRKRKEDIPLLSENFLEKFNHIYRRKIETIDDATMSAFMNYDWPGNIRELENIVERAVILCRKRIISLDCLPEEFCAGERTGQNILSARAGAEAETIKAALIKYDFNVSKAARSLGVHRTTVYRKIKRYNIEL
jgi:PAS domain S-box-containing protein